jgi:pyridoxamine 5'-phosphate oxidase
MNAPDTTPSPSSTAPSVADLRRDYTRAGLNRRDLAGNPIDQFRLWFDQAMGAELLEPNAMSLGTVSAEGRPHLRTVLLKAYDDRGFVFFTNYQSRKARDMEGNPNVSLLLAWLPLERQVAINGLAEKISLRESLAYFRSRPRGSQIGAWVSQQSSVISKRALLEAKWEEMKRKFMEGDIPLPDFWGGYRVVPQEIEFWQGRQNRLHDRFVYRRPTADETWSIERLSP